MVNGNMEERMKKKVIDVKCLHTKWRGQGLVFLCTNSQTRAHGLVNRLREMIDFMHIENNLLLQLNKNIINGIGLWTT